MDFRAQAGFALSLHLCQVCDCDIDPNDAVYYDADLAGSGDDERVKIRVWHGACWDAVSQAADKAAADAWEEAAKFHKHNSPEDAAVACQLRADRLRRKTAGESGADVLGALFGDLGKAS